MKATLIEALGRTDQLFLQENSADLALQRAEIRLALCRLSQQPAEQRYFVQQAIVILEQARLVFDDVPFEVFLALSIELSRAYLAMFELSQETRFALIAEQIIKPFAHHQQVAIYDLLIEAAQAQQHTALARHWQKKRLLFTAHGESV